jgi:hypothetical protein
LSSSSLNEFCSTNNNGFAKFSSLTRGEDFELEYGSLNLDNIQKESFVCDGREQYLIKFNENINITVNVKYKSGLPVQNKNFQVNSIDSQRKEYNTKKLGKFSFKLKIKDSLFTIEDGFGVNILSEKIPSKDTNYIIEVDDLIVENTEESNEKEDLINDKSSSFIFLNAFGRPIKNLNVEFKNNDFLKNYQTDQEGKIHLANHNLNKINYSFVRYKEYWSYNVVLNNEEVHIVKIKPIFPWLWWLLISLLIILLWCCAFGNCFCNNLHSSNTSYNDLEEISEQIISKPCNVQTISGGEGTTVTIHTLGENSGRVKLSYDMQDIPDRLEVFYQSKLIASTYDIVGNNDGFVGDNLNSGGGQSTIIFFFNKDVDDFITVVVEGSKQDTSWDYVISCPN